MNLAWQFIPAVLEYGNFLNTYFTRSDLDWPLRHGTGAPLRRIRAPLRQNENKKFPKLINYLNVFVTTRTRQCCSL